eukprot:TRINITY_DN3065_c0_g1_i1.p1 TRINITY_DN3065_c0_g1~~TRINITY_DN3065_c0_g1_i1.p1  ORF type:complete len:488 (-),score=47.82 TRINITY_DN3065_c0_g1_i1:292-1755(-)
MALSRLLSFCEPLSLLLSYCFSISRINRNMNQLATMGDTKKEKYSSKVGSYKEEEKGEDGGGYDLISELPDPLLCSIISFLPFKDAVRTSIISRKWRYKWTSISCVNIDESFFIPKKKKNQLIKRWKYDGVADRFLRSLEGPIITCRISVGGLSDFILDHLLKTLNLKGIQEFALFSFRYIHPIPPFIFSSSSIRLLELEFCTFEPTLPFPGLANLTVLKLGETLIDEATVRELLSHCLHLEILELLLCQGFSNLNVCSKSLKRFKLEDRHRKLKNLSIDTPNLESLIFGDRCITSLVQIRVYDAPKLQFFGIIDGNAKLLELGGNRFEYESPEMPCTIRTPFYTTRSLVIKANFNDDRQAILVASLLRCFPCLEELDVLIEDMHKSSARDVNFWESQGSIDCLNDHLKKVKMIGFTGDYTDVGFARFLITNSKVLQKMDIYCWENCTKQWAAAKMCNLSLEKKASSNAEIHLWQFRRRPGLGSNRY